MSKARTLFTLVYSATLAYLYYVAYQRDGQPAQWKNNPFISFDSFGGRWKFLTIIDVALQGLFFALCALSALLTLASVRHHSFRKLLNTYYTAVTFPIGAVHNHQYKNQTKLT